MRPSARRPARRKRLAWLLATKAAMAMALALPASFRRDTAEYRALAPLHGLEPGAPVTLAGQLIGKVVAMDRRGDTTALRVRFVRGAERLPGSRAARLRRLGFAGTGPITLELRVADRSRQPRQARRFTLGGWLQVLPFDGTDELFVDPPTPRRLTPLPSPFSMPVIPRGRAIQPPPART